MNNINITAKIDVKKLKDNIDYFKKKSGSDVMVVLKGNAYGHGLEGMAKTCRKLGVEWIGVANLYDALKIRNSGDQGKILAWIYYPKSKEIDEALKKNIDIALFDENHLPILSKKIKNNANIHLFVDTGINRNGVPYEKAIETAIKISKNPKMNMIGLMSHFCCENNRKMSEKQIKMLKQLKQKLNEIGIKPNLTHIANTVGSLKYDVSDFDLARIGYGSFGLLENKNLQPIVSLNSKIIQLKYVNKGEGIGYNRTYVTPNKKYIAIVPIGYGDILPIVKSGQLTLDVNGSKRKILGKESMDQITIEAKECDKLGDEVKIFGPKEEGYSNDVNKFAKLAKIKPYIMMMHLRNDTNKIIITK